MKKLELYQCEICGTQYANKKDCKDCEDSHIRTKCISGTKYNAKNIGSNDGLPVKITVTFENGVCADYRRQGNK